MVLGYKALQLLADRLIVDRCQLQRYLLQLDDFIRLKNQILAKIIFSNFRITKTHELAGEFARTQRDRLKVFLVVSHVL